MGINGIFIIMLVYGVLLTYIWQMVKSNNKKIVYLKSTLLLILYVFFSSTILFTYKGQEYHINNHSGLEPISLIGEAVFTTVVLSTYSIVILFLNILLKRKRDLRKSTKLEPL